MFPITYTCREWETFDDDVINRYYAINQLIYGHKYVT